MVKEDKLWQTGKGMEIMTEDHSPAMTPERGIIGERNTYCRGWIGKIKAIPGKAWHPEGCICEKFTYLLVRRKILKHKEDYPLSGKYATYGL